MPKCSPFLSFFMNLLASILLFFSLINSIETQGEIVDLSDDGILTIAAGEEESEDSDEPKIEKQILVLGNHFPDYLNFFCQPRTRLMRDRFCFGSLDAYAIACSDDNPPLQLVPFCIGFKFQCSKLSFPTDDWCEAEFTHYDRHCKIIGRNECSNCKYGYDVSCICEPYSCLEKRAGTRTAEWCQRYELYCNATDRSDKKEEVNVLMGDAVRVHKQCIDLFGLSHAICNPFTRNFQWERCQKFLFDCELISDFPAEQKTEEIGGETEVLTKEQLNEEILKAQQQAQNPELIAHEKIAEKIKMEREKTKEEKAREERIKQDRILAMEEAEREASRRPPDSSVPEFFVGQAERKGNRLVINRVKIEPGQVIDRIVTTTNAPRPFMGDRNLPSNTKSLAFRPEEVFSLANEVAGGKVRIPKKRGATISNPNQRIVFNENWAARFLPYTLAQ